MTPLEAVGYRVLARKYRPKTFADLIGQDAMVTILANAFQTDEIGEGLRPVLSSEDAIADCLEGRQFAHS